MAETLVLSAEAIASLPSGKGVCHRLGKISLIIFKPADGSLIKVAPNTCLHMTQTLSPDVEDTGLMKCGMHNALLDPATMTYKSGPTFLKGMGKPVNEGTPQPTFSVTMNPDGSATLTPPEGFKSGGGGCSVI